MDKQLDAVKDVLEKSGWDYETAESRKKADQPPAR